MGRFISAYRRAVDPTIPLPARYLKFIEACSAFGRLSGLRLQRTHDSLGALFGFSRAAKPDAAQMTLALAALVQVRFRLLHLLSEARLQKRKRKMAGNRAKQPAPFQPEEVIHMIERLRQPMDT